MVDDAVAAQALAALVDSRDLVVDAINSAKAVAGYPSTDRRLAALVKQLDEHDAAIRALENPHGR
jgi:hypothetical protein